MGMDNDAPTGAERPTPTKLAADVGISVPYAWQLLNGTRVPPNPMALRIWRAAGVKLGALEALSDEECAQLERLSGAVREASNASEGQAA